MLPTYPAAPCHACQREEPDICTMYDYTSSAQCTERTAPIPADPHHPQPDKAEGKRIMRMTFREITVLAGL